MKRMKKRLMGGAAIVACALAVGPPAMAAITFSPDGWSKGTYPNGAQITVNRVLKNGACGERSSYVLYLSQRLETATSCPASASAGQSGTISWKVCTNKKGTDSCSTTVIS